MKKDFNPVELINQEFIHRKSHHLSYSMRAFARDLGMSAAQLSRILSGARNLTHKQASHIAVALNLPKPLALRFVQHTILNAPKNSKVSLKLKNETALKFQNQKLNAEDTSATTAVTTTSISIEHFKAISQWYHFAILSLIYVKGFDPSPDWIAERLKISSLEAKTALNRLIDLGFLEKDSKGKLKEVKPRLFVESRHSEPEIRNFNRTMIEKAKLEIDKTSDFDFSRRLINSITFPTSPESVQEIKKMIIQFQKEVLAYIKTQPHEEVYQLNCQLFPLTKAGKK